MKEKFLVARDVLKVYGSTTAVNHLDIDINKKEILALVGGNGAGKSTITKILSGVVKCDSGSIEIEGNVVDTHKFSPDKARKYGIFVVHQELSLCKNLTVYENFYVEQYQQFDKKVVNWRKKARDLAKTALETVFPLSGIDINAELSSLSIAQQQMVEIARATSTPDLRMLILDEPTSSLPAEQTKQLLDYIKNSSQKGVSYIYISHRLKEIMSIADRIVVMQNGAKKHECLSCETDEKDMVLKMSSGFSVTTKQSTVVTAETNNPNIEINFENYSSSKIKNITTSMNGGEIVCLTGLEGNGQLEFLQEIFYNATKKTKCLKTKGKVSFVAGDRKNDGNFPLWSIKDNAGVSLAAGEKLFKPQREKNISNLLAVWKERLKIKYNDSSELQTSLSGGNQQKVLIARTMAVEADIILLDDPTRGVDLETKLELYEVFREAAKQGKLIIWRTSDDEELEYATRILVMSKGTIVKEYDPKDCNHADLLKVAFEHQEKKETSNIVQQKSNQPKLYLFALITMIVLYGVCGSLSPMVLTKRGFELLAVGYIPFVFCAIAQTFIIGLGHIDLSIGAFMGLVNVITATLLKENTFLGLFALVFLLLLYSFMGLFIYWKNIPSIVVTLGMSFVWLGVAYNLQPMPGGEVPAWMIAVINFRNPVLKGVLIWGIVFIIISILIYRSRYGTVLKGFGNNENAMINSGWSKAKAFFMTYFISGCFAIMGGFAQSGITGASDVNASSTYTMLTVAAVIIGGGFFSGGIVTHIGTICGAVSLTMVSILLGLLKVSTDYTAAVQGFVLILILAIRTIRKGIKEHG